ncbi:MAG: O-antigen/teichoic acid export membrane protein [Candidatus Latescibacterota bacterium]|jgi:O-antigen/teichoic acid export membrane protein
MSESRKIIRSFFYTVASGYVARLGSLLITFLLRDELGPEAFDITLTGLIIFILFSGVRDFGWMHSLLHFQEYVESFVQTHFFLNALISFAVCLLTCVVAGGLYFYDQSRYAWPATVICTCSILYFIRCLTQTSEALLRKDFEFGRLGLFHGLATISALCTSLCAAWYGWEHWSLLLGGWTTYSVFSLVYTLTYSSAVWISRPIGIWPIRIDWVWVRKLLNYGKWFWLAWGVLLNFIWNFDKLFLSIVDNGSLGLYEYAWWLMQLPTAIVTHIVFSYTNTLYSRFQGNRKQLGTLFSRIMAIILRVSSLVALILAISANEVTALLKVEWAPAAAMMVSLTAYAFLRPLFDDGIGLLWAVGDTKRTALIMGGQAVGVIVLVPVLWWWAGIQGVCYAMGVVAGVGVLGVATGVRRYADIEWGIIVITPVVALVVAAISSVIYNSIELDFGEPISNMTVRAGCVGGVYCGAIWVLERQRLVLYLSQLKCAVF